MFLATRTASPPWTQWQSGPAAIRGADQWIQRIEVGRGKRSPLNAQDTTEGTWIYGEIEDDRCFDRLKGVDLTFRIKVCAGHDVDDLMVIRGLSCR
ncbi:hypothetical protein Tdes44962_MAKER02099 [Teratosphaeria destructans]|uniref:Uncharacterized protein n=1 Tax=Teratosphaeria destructans TaxID=418781 RepID=A0A9W7SVN3_9PEZI|nr:hypothetical protein Tdes44962_MAKER02099 [Teratosphaeria destructans]